MRAWIMPWVGCGLLLAPLSAMAGQVIHHVPPATVGCAQPGALQRMAGLSATATSERTLTQLHCRRVDGTGNWQVVGHHGDVVLLRHLPIHKGEGALYFPAAILQPMSGWEGPRSFGLPRLVMAGIGAVMLWPLLRYGWRFLRRWQAWRVCRRLVARHADALRIRRRQLVQLNSYGVERTTRWRREQAEFIRTIVQPALRKSRLQWAWPIIAARVQARIEHVASQKPSGGGAGQASSGYAPDMDPIAYERYCAERLCKCGWDAQATPPGGDQGADVIAIRGRTRLVVQCKLYRNAVGNEAVQQISAARLHYHADIAAVVSNADYTNSARQLARSNNVFLLHHDELPAFATRLARARKKA
ncbi:restriction endonuclease [Komagataeibacter diospyri]|uniref:restriction endonuclease n=1 Tax=Komagataeibacter diospyri TaxID=1932662 RepID=UPI0037571B6B